MAINDAFLRHGVFTQLGIRDTLTRFQNYGAAHNAPPPDDQQRIARFIQALKDMQIGSVFIQLFSRGGDVEDNDTDKNARAQLITALGAAGIHWVGWGYCAGKNCNTDKGLILQFKRDLNMQAFMIDAEPGNKVIPNPQDKKHPLPDIWTVADFDDFTAFAHQQFGTDNLALTTWPVLQIQDDPANNIPLIALMRTAAPRVGLFVPQAYWMSYPTDVHYSFGLSRQDYPPNDPVSFVRLVIKSWSMLNFTQPLNVAGQAYWGEDGPDQHTMEGKVDAFVKNFRDWPEVLGFSWYHAASLSDAMIASITGAKLGAKPYQQPAALPPVAAAIV